MTTTPTPEHDWLLPPEPPSASERPRRAGRAGAVALVTAGVLVGGGVAFAAGHHGASTPAAAQGQLPPGFGAGTRGTVPRQGTVAHGGGLDGEQHLQGTLTAVGASTVT